jgi:beta-galactosidase/beta-glucuronidase
MMKQMGCNFLRSAHNDPAPSLLEASDRLGLLVWGETPYLGPSNRVAPPLRDLIRRGRNHPSVICWSLANTAGGKDCRPDVRQKSNPILKRTPSLRFFCCVVVSI